MPSQLDGIVTRLLDGSRSATSQGALALLIAACLPGCRTEIENCYPGLAIGDVLEVELLARYDADTEYRWIPSLGDTVGLPSCAGIDGWSGASTHQLTVSQRSGALGCWSYGGVPTVLPLDVSSEGSAAPGGGLYMAQLPYGETGYWQVIVLPTDIDDLHPLGDEAVRGSAPPVVVRRTISNLRDWACMDIWAGEVRRVGPTTDTGDD